MFKRMGLIWADMIEQIGDIWLKTSNAVKIASSASLSTRVHLDTQNSSSFETIVSPYDLNEQFLQACKKRKQHSR